MRIAPKQAVACALVLPLAAGVLGAQGPGQPPVEQPSPAGQQDPQRDPEPGSQNPDRQRVLVTARKWEEDVLDVPRSITALGERALRNTGATTVREAAFTIPNTLFTEFASRRLSFPYVRGIGSGQGDPAVTTFYDGVPQLTVSSTNRRFLDLDRVEFLRGPSGVLFGRNTVGGSIHIHSKAPEFQFGGDARVTVGNFARRDAAFAVTGPVSEDLAVRVSGLYSARDGYTDNDFTGNDVDFRETSFGRVQALWTPDDDTEVRVILFGEHSRDGGFVLTDRTALRANPFRINQDFEGSNDREMYGATAIWTEDAENGDFTSITNVQGFEIEEKADFDFSFIDGVRRFTNEDQFSVYQEFRWASEEDGESIAEDVRMRWLAGVSGFYADSERSAANEFRPAGGGILFPPSNVGTDSARGEFEDHAFAVFGQATFLMGDRFEFTSALRLDYESKEAELSRVFDTGAFVVPTSASSPAEDIVELLPRFSLSYRATDDVLAYATAARGFKAAGFNLTSPSGFETYDTETSWTYELGVRGRFLDGDVDASAAVFYVDWEDMQLSQFDATSGGFVANAGEATSLGFEAEVAGRPVEWLEIFGSVGLLNTEFDRFTDSFGQDVSGRDLPFAPETTGTFGAQAQKTWEDGSLVFARAEYQSVGEFHYDAGNLGTESYHLVNLRVGGGGTLNLGERTQTWRLEGFVLNATDEEYVGVAFQPNPADPTAFVGENGAPLTWGFTFTLTF